ncbi:vWA domain-containing protein [Legionella sp.]|uniref:vWA domain-containing protein n=1 Tax=Legionella sp. TaxID=459 RepID=UPI0032208013
MSKLSNYLLREKSLKEFLAAMGLDLAQIRLSSVDDFFLFDFNEIKQVEGFVKKLNELITGSTKTKVKPLNLEMHPGLEITGQTVDLGDVDQVEENIKSFSLIELIEADIAQATGNTPKMLETHRQACKALLTIIKSQGAYFVFSQESNLFELTLPDPAYASMLNLLNYPHLFVNAEGRLVFDLKKYLRNSPDKLIKITREETNEPPLLFLNSNALKKQQIYYATKELDEGRLEVTPYFFVPHAISPPNYHFILDVSGSMAGSLPELKKSVKSLAQQLFAFQPDAQLTITTFSKGIKEIGVYRAGLLEQLNSDVDGLVTETNTPLYEVTANFLERIKSSNNQNNLLLFTDGEDNDSKEDSIQRIHTVINGLRTHASSIRVRNKFNVFSYKVGRDSLMHEVANVFDSELVETSSADFVAAQEDPELLMRWAAARELFSMRLVVTDKLGGQTIEQYQQSLDMSGQLTSLKPRICLPGETLEISVADGTGTPLLESSKRFIREVVTAVTQETSKETSFIPKFFLDCVDQCIEVARNYITDVAHTCPSYFHPDHPNYWRTNGQVFFNAGLPSGHSNCSLQMIASPSSQPLQLGFSGGE